MTGGGKVDRRATAEAGPQPDAPEEAAFSDAPDRIAPSADQHASAESHAAEDAAAGDAAEVSLVWPPPEEDIEALETVPFADEPPAAAAPAARPSRTGPRSGELADVTSAAPRDWVGAFPGDPETRVGDAAGRRAWPERLRSRRVPPAVLLAATLALAIAAGYYTAARLGPWAGGVRQQAVLIVESQPPGAPVLVDGMPRGTTPLRLALPSGSRRIEIETSAGRRAATLELAAGSETTYVFDLNVPAAPVAGSPAAGTGALEIVSDPAGAGVVVEGRPRGRTPLTLTGLGPGIHEVLVSQGGRSRLERATVTAGRTATLSVSFGAPATAAAAGASSPERGSLSVRAPIALQVSIGSRVIGSSARRISMPAGRHTVELVNDAVGFRTTEQVEIAAGRNTALDVTVPEGRVNVNATPWATVWIGDRRLGDTPLANIALPAGEYEFIFRHPELGERRHVAVVGPGRTARVAVDLRQ